MAAGRLCRKEQLRCQMVGAHGSRAGRGAQGRPVFLSVSPKPQSCSYSVLAPKTVITEDIFYLARTETILVGYLDRNTDFKKQS